MTIKMMTGLVVGVIMLVFATAAQAGSDLKAALKSGAVRLTSEQIAKQIVGKTVTVALGKKRFLFHYSKDNVLSGRLIGGNWSDSGYYGITDDNRVCLSMTKDKGRLRCMTLLKQNGTIRKYNTAGKATFTLLEFSNGKTF